MNQVSFTTNGSISYLNFFDTVSAVRNAQQSYIIAWQNLNNFAITTNSLVGNEQYACTCRPLGDANVTPTNLTTMPNWIVMVLAALTPGHGHFASNDKQRPCSTIIVTNGFVSAGRTTFYNLLLGLSNQSANSLPHISKALNTTHRIITMNAQSEFLSLVSSDAASAAFGAPEVPGLLHSFGDSSKSNSPLSTLQRIDKDLTFGSTVDIVMHMKRKQFSREAISLLIAGTPHSQAEIDAEITRRQTAKLGLFTVELNRTFRIWADSMRMPNYPLRDLGFNVPVKHDMGMIVGWHATSLVYRFTIPNDVSRMFASADAKDPTWNRLRLIHQLCVSPFDSYQRVHVSCDNIVPFDDMLHIGDAQTGIGFITMVNGDESMMFVCLPMELPRVDANTRSTMTHETPAGAAEMCNYIPDIIEMMALTRCVRSQVTSEMLVKRQAWLTAVALAWQKCGISNPGLALFPINLLAMSTPSALATSGLTDVVSNDVFVEQSPRSFEVAMRFMMCF